MPLESEDPFANGTGTAGMSARSMLSGYGREGREEIVRDRLRRLLAVLGDVPLQRSITAPNWGNTLGQVLDDTCSPGTMVMHGRRLPDRLPDSVPDRVPDSGLRLEHVAVAPRGLVVIGPYLGHTPAGAPSHRDALGNYKSANGVGSSPFPRGQLSARRSGPVRETLRRSRAMRSWLAETRWAEVPVLAAVCSAAVLGPTANPARALGGLWLGPANELPAWLASGRSLDGTTCGALAYFLASELAPG
jgi:hypothetical protein